MKMRRKPTPRQQVQELSKSEQMRQAQRQERHKRMESMTLPPVPVMTQHQRNQLTVAVLKLRPDQRRMLSKWLELALRPQYATSIQNLPAQSSPLVSASALVLLSAIACPED